MVMMMGMGLMPMVVVVLVVMMMLMVMVVMAAALRVVALLASVGRQSLQCRLKGILPLHGLHKLPPGQLLPGSGDDYGGRILGPQQLDCGLELVLLDIRRAGEDNGSRIFNLIVIKFTEILHIAFALGGIGHRNHAADLHILRLGPLYGLGHIAELAHPGGLNKDTVRVILLHDLLKGLTKISHQGAADTAGVHFRDLDARLLEKAPVNADFTELIFNEYDFLATVDLCQELLNQSSLACAQEPGENINFCHNNTF